MEGQCIGIAAPTQPCPGFCALQEPLGLINVVFCHARMVDHIIDMFRERLALALELPELDGGDELEGLAERRGAGAVERRRWGYWTKRKGIEWSHLGWAMTGVEEQRNLRRNV